MVTITSIFLAVTDFVSAIVATPATPTNATDLEAIDKHSLTLSPSGYHCGYYYSFWTDGAGSVAYDNWDTGTYHTSLPLVGYDIVESYGSYNPGSGGTYLGTVYSDGSNYDIYSTFQQYRLVRRNKRSQGTVTTGLKVRNHNYQIMATGGYCSSGSVTVTVA
ncbi:Xyn11A, glycoside hydrolase family 11 protein [Xylariaceae sp. AK1471]|nr:Xyn11A, glycoside hydrolase family 11 protein [Xylariaceae sp. AK1471]